MTTTATIPPVTVTCSRVSLLTTTVTLAPTFVDQTKLGQHDVALLPQLISRDTLRGFVGLTTMPQQQQPWSQIPSQAHDNYVMSPPKVRFLFQI